MILNLDIHSANTVAAIDSSGNQLLYGDITAFSEYLSDILPSRSLVFILTHNNVGGIAWGISLINARIVPLFLNAEMEAGLYKQLYNLYLPRFICLPEEQADKYNFLLVTTKYGYSLLDTQNEIYPLYEHLSHLLPTSGSTGSPKLVRHCYDNIKAAALNISTFFKLKDSDRPLMVLPLYYTMGLSIVFSHFYVGATILITDLSMTDRAFWHFMKEKRATSFTGVPCSFEILNLMRFFHMDLPDLQLLTQGGGRMPRELNLKFAEYCREQGKSWIATYGQSEGTARMAYLPVEYAISKCGSIGYAVPNGELSLIDSEGNLIISPNVEGEMCYRGKNVTLGYALKREDLLLGDERQGFLRTGDLAYRDEDGCYYIVGRMGRFLKLYGMRIGLDECEQIIKGKYIIDCACAGTDEKMIVYITDQAFASAVKEELVEKTHIVASAFEVRVIAELPQSGAGKTLYSKLSNY
jgi:acyl-coenzyme A synthetase/AMP-(fatty) acid ligase